MEFLFVTGFTALLFRGTLSAGTQKNCFSGQNYPPSRQLHLVLLRYIRKIRFTDNQRSSNESNIYHALPYHSTMYIKEFRFLMVANLATISQSMVLCKENCKSGRVGEGMDLSFQPFAISTFLPAKAMPYFTISLIPRSFISVS